jgi:hypothetical protein
MVAVRFLLFVFFSSFLVMAHAAKEDAFTTTIERRLSLDANGKIDDLKPVNPDSLPEVRKQVEPIVRAWHFTPGKLDGRPAPTETTLGVRSAFEAESTNAIRHHVRIASAGTGGTYMHVVKPNYPEVSQRSHGRRSGVVDQVRRRRRRHIGEERARDECERHKSCAHRCSDRRVEKWTFRPETVAGRGVASDALVPVCFKLREEPCHWKPRRDKPQMQSGDTVALSSVVGLETAEGQKLP